MMPALLVLSEGKHTAWMKRTRRLTPNAFARGTG